METERPPEPRPDEPRPTGDGDRPQALAALLADAEAIMGLGVWSYDLASGDAIVSDGAYRLAGLDPAAGTAALRARIPAADLAAVEACIREAAATGEPFATNHRLVATNGRTRWIRIEGRTFLGPDGRPDRVVGTSQDVTERQAAATREAARDALLAEAEAIARVGSWEWDISADRLVWSDELRRIFGVGPAFDASYEGYLGFIHPDDRGRVDARVREAFGTGEPFTFDHRIVRPDGEVRQTHCEGQVVVGAEGQAIRMVGICQDVTDRERAAEALRRSEITLAEAQRLANIGSWGFDLATRSFEASEQLYRVYGLDPAGGPYDVHAITARIHPEDQARVVATVTEAAALGRDYDYAYRVVREDGEVRHVYARTVAVAGPDGSSARLLGVVQDVTTARRTEARLAEALAIARMGRWEWDVLTGEVTWSDELRDLIGGIPEGADMDASGLRALVHPDDLPEVERISRAAITGPAPFSYEFRVHGVPGEGRTMLLRGQTIFDVDGRPVRQFGTIQDVTEARRAEEALRRSLAVLAVQRDGSPDGILLVDEHAQVLSSNRRFHEMWGIPAALLDEDADQRLLGHVAGLVAHPEAFLARVRALYASRTEVADEEVELRDGRVFHRYSAPAIAPDGTYYGRLWVFRDITERKRMEAALQAQNEQLRELDRLKITFINAVSHELRVPLTSVLGYAEFIEEMLEADQPPPADLAQAREYLATVQVNARRLQVLVDDLLDFALLEAGMFQLRKEHGDFAQRVREAAAALRPQATKHEQRIELELPARPVPAAMDGQRIGQVLVNLLANALKFTPAGADIGVRVLPLPGRVRCEIADAGGGIDPEDLPRLFQRYGQLEAGKRRGGSGLGLYISKALVEAHGGAIGVESVPGEGSTFWFELPTP